MIEIPDYKNNLYRFDAGKRILDSNYQIIKGNYVHKKAIIDWDNITIGKENIFGPMAVIGSSAQHKYYESSGKIEIGNKNVFSEFSVVSRPTVMTKKTIIEDGNYFMSNSVIHHDCKIENNTIHAKHLYTILIDKKKLGITRDEFMMKLHAKGIGTGVHYRSIPSYTFYKKKFKWKQSDYKNSSLIGDQTVSLPLSPNLTEKNFNKILLTIEKVLKN